MVLLLDNYDSFVWNIVHTAAAVAPSLHLHVVRSDQIDAASALALAPSHLIVSPGPCGPREAGNSNAVIRSLAGRVPILGICLGHQCIADAFGITVSRAPEPVHGSTSFISHDARGVFSGLPSPLQVMRYHSLIADAATIDASRWEISAWIDEPRASAGRLVMGLRRIWSPADPFRAPLVGVQFHPESFGTQLGAAILANFFGTSPGVPGGQSRTTIAP